MNLNDIKDELHDTIIRIGDEIYEQRIIKDQVEPINASKEKFRNEKRYENHERIKYKLDLQRHRFDCEIEYLKYHYTEKYYTRKKHLEKLFFDGLPMMIVFLIQKLDYEMQRECKDVLEQITHDMEGDFKILLSCVLERKAKELTEQLEQLVQQLFEKDFEMVQKIWLYCKNNIEAHANLSICENIVKTIHIKCCENAASRINRWHLRKMYKDQTAVITRYIKSIKQWRPQLTMCQNNIIWRKHFAKILKKFQKYYNFYNWQHNVFSFQDTIHNIAQDGVDQPCKPPSEHKLDTTPSAIFAAFEGNTKYCCGDESNVYVVTKSDVIPITTICTEQMDRLKQKELAKLKPGLPSDKYEVNWNLCDTYGEEAPSADNVNKMDGPKEKKNIEMPNLLTDLFVVLDPVKIATNMVQLLNDGLLTHDNAPHMNTKLKQKISMLLKHEIEHKLNDEEVLNRLNAVLGPAYDAVRMKRISALSYIKDSMTIMRNRTPDPESVFIPYEEEITKEEPKQYHVSLEMTHEEYLDSFIKLPPYLFPERKRPPFDSIYAKASETDFRESVIGTELVTHYLGAGPFLNVRDPNQKKEFDRARHRATSILKQNPRERLRPIYKMTIRTVIDTLNKNAEADVENNFPDA